MKDIKFGWDEDRDMGYRRYVPFETIKIAMIGGKEMEYDICTSKYPSEFDYTKDFTYIGAGYIYSINGIVQRYGPDDVMHFWVHK